MIGSEGFYTRLHVKLMEVLFVQWNVVVVRTEQTVWPAGPGWVVIKPLAYVPSMAYLWGE